MKVLAHSFSKESLYMDDIVIYLKNERTGSSTVRKCKFIGQIIGTKGSKIIIRRFSKPDIFVTPDECSDCGEDVIYSEDIVHVLLSQSMNVQDKVCIPKDEYKKLLEYEYKYGSLNK